MSRDSASQFVAAWTPVATMLLVSFISYVDRNTLALLAPTILEETHLTAEQYGLVISAFSVAYMVGNPLWGRALDVWGVRWGMKLAVFLWTAASASHALACGVWGFAVARAVLGFGEGATFPGGLRVAVQTLPPSKRSRGIAIAYSGGSLGAVFTPLLITPIALAAGWRAAFLFTGAIGVAWLALWTVVSRRPDVRTSPRAAERTDSGLRMRASDIRIWSFGLLYAAGALPIAFVIYGSALYLNRVLGAGQALIGKLLWIPPLGWEVGYFFWGWLADRGARREGGRAALLRKLLGAVAVLALPLAAVPWMNGLGMVMAGFFLAMFSAAGFIILSIAHATDLYSPRYAGLISGIGSAAWSGTVAVMMPVFGRLLDLGRYPEAFALAAALPPAGYLVWRLMSGRG